MKQIKTLRFNINKILILSIVIYTFSCKAQVLDNYSFKEFRDSNGKVYKKDCYKGDFLCNTLYIDSSGKEFNVCIKPEFEAYTFIPENEFLNYVKDNMVWPINREVEGKIYISLLIDKQGNVIEKRVLKEIDVCPECTIKAMELIGKLNKWKPAVYKSNPVRSIKYLIIPFK